MELDFGTKDGGAPNETAFSHANIAGSDDVVGEMAVGTDTGSVAKASAGSDQGVVANLGAFAERTPDHNGLGAKDAVSTDVDASQLGLDAAPRAGFVPHPRHATSSKNGLRLDYRARANGGVVVDVTAAAEDDVVVNLALPDDAERINLNVATKSRVRMDTGERGYYAR